jgi:hypothetical protein
MRPQRLRVAGIGAARTGSKQHQGNQRYEILRSRAFHQHTPVEVSGRRLASLTIPGSCKTLRKETKTGNTNRKSVLFQSGFPFSKPSQTV